MVELPPDYVDKEGNKYYIDPIGNVWKIGKDGKARYVGKESEFKQNKPADVQKFDKQQYYAEKLKNDPVGTVAVRRASIPTSTSTSTRNTNKYGYTDAKTGQEIYFSNKQQTKPQGEIREVSIPKQLRNPVGEFLAGTYIRLTKYHDVAAPLTQAYEMIYRKINKKEPDPETMRAIEFLGSMATLEAGARVLGKVIKPLVSRVADTIVDLRAAEVKQGEGLVGEGEARVKNYIKIKRPIKVRETKIPVTYEGVATEAGAYTELRTPYYTADVTTTRQKDIIKSVVKVREEGTEIKSVSKEIQKISKETPKETITLSTRRGLAKTNNSKELKEVVAFERESSKFSGSRIYRSVSRDPVVKDSKLAEEFEEVITKPEAVKPNISDALATIEHNRFVSRVTDIFTKIARMGSAVYLFNKYNQFNINEISRRYRFGKKLQNTPVSTNTINTHYTDIDELVNEKTRYRERTTTSDRETTSTTTKVLTVDEPLPKLAPISFSPNIEASIEPLPLKKKSIFIPLSEDSTKKSNKKAKTKYKYERIIDII